MIWSLAALAQALAERSNQKDIAGMLNRLGSLAKSEFEAGVMCDKSRAASETTINAAP
jgi:hypothetical protein